MQSHAILRGAGVEITLLAVKHKDDMYRARTAVLQQMQ